MNIILGYMSLLNLCLARRRKAKPTEDYKGRHNTRVNNKIIERTMKSFGQKSWMLPQPALIIGTYDKEGKPNAMNAAWLESLHGMKKGRHYD